MGVATLWCDQVFDNILGGFSCGPGEREEDFIIYCVDLYRLGFE